MAIDNTKIAEEVLAAVGGPENITSATHCMTRLRLNLKDQSVPNDDEIKKIKGVLGAQWSGGQYQVIIGQNVPKVYDAAVKLGVKGDGSIDENLDAPKEKLTPKSAANAAMNYLSGSVTPMIPVLLCAGLFKTIATLLGPSMLNVASAEDDIIVLMNMLFNAAFYFLPIYLGYNAARVLGVTPVLGAFMGGILIEPTFLSLASEDASFSIYFIPCEPRNYAQTVIPVLLSVFAMKYLERFFKRVIPDMLSTIFVPFLTMACIVPVSLCLLAPLGSWVGEGMAQLFNGIGAMGGIWSTLGIGLIAALWTPLVMTGMHVTVNALAVANFMVIGYDNFVIVGTTIAIWGTFGAEFASWLKLRDRHEKSQALGYFLSNIIGGVGEPFIYGVMMRYRKVFACKIIGSFAAGIVAGAMGVTAYVAAGAANILGLLKFAGGSGENMMFALIAALVGFVVSGVLTFMFGFSEDELENGPLSER